MSGAGAGAVGYGADETHAALRRILDAEQRERRSAESKAELMKSQIEMMRDMMMQLKDEMEAMRLTLLDGENEREALQMEIAYRLGHRLDSASSHECDRLESEIRTVLEKVHERRLTIEREKDRGSTDDRRLCVVCQSVEKSIVLLPCRHMCLCETCAEHEAMKACPLCRRPIAHKFSVFS